MTNMMNGAVAIYGGYGAMEIRQPLPQAVESVAQAVEDLAVNAHISLRELKNRVDKVLEKKIPGYKQLMEMNPVIAARTVVNDATITAYTNGYAVYEADNAHSGQMIVQHSRLLSSAQDGNIQSHRGEKALRNNQKHGGNDYEKGIQQREERVPVRDHDHAGKPRNAGLRRRWHGVQVRRPHSDGRPILEGRVHCRNL